MKEATEIKELDRNKYLVLKWEDIKACGGFMQATGLCAKLNLLWQSSNKKDNGYLVLNLDDEIDLRYLYGKIYDAITPTPLPPHENKPNKVSDIALALVNAIEKAKEML